MNGRKCGWTVLPHGFSGKAFRAADLTVHPNNSLAKKRHRYPGVMKQAFFLTLLSTAFVLTGCGSVSVRPGKTTTSPTAKALPPRQILVADFTLNDEGIHADREGEELAVFKQKMSADLKRNLIKALLPLGIPPAESSLPTPFAGKRQAAWLITGQLIDVTQGSRALRSFVGFGLGQTHLETEVRVYDLSVSPSIPVLTFQTTGGSGAEPGAVLSANPVSFALSAGGSAISTGLSVDTKRTARMIAAHLSTSLAARGYIPADKVRKAKIKEESD